MRFLDLRHCFGYQMASAGASGKMIAKAMGITEKVAEVYTDHNPQELSDLGIALLNRHQRAASNQPQGAESEEGTD